jgi:broad specificity phosphatase PhoE
MSNYQNTKLYIIRHAQSQANHKRRCTGWLDVDLSDTGVSQAEMSRKYFADIKVDNVYASTLKRAYRTAHIIFGDDKKIKRMDEFKELNVGLFEMKTHEELLTEFNDTYKNWLADPTLSDPPEGENLNDYYKRVIAGLETVAKENIGKTAAIVAHGGVIRCFVVYALNMRLNDIWNIKVDNLSVSCIELSGGKKALTLLNDTCHLEHNA